MGREPIADMNHRLLYLSVTLSFGRWISRWGRRGVSFGMRHCGSRLLLRLEGVCSGHDCVPNEMGTLEGDGCKHQLKIVSVGVLLADDIP